MAGTQGLAEKVFFLDKAVGHLIYESKPASHLTNIGGCWEVSDGLNILVRRLDPLHGDLEARKLHGLLSKHELVRGEYHSVLVEVGQH